jgi:hypothetical protein
VESDWERHIGFVSNGELEAEIISVPEESLDGWSIRIFPTFVASRIICAVSSTWIEEILDDIEDNEQASQFIVNHSVSNIASYFEANSTNIS